MCGGPDMEWQSAQILATVGIKSLGLKRPGEKMLLPKDNSGKAGL